MLGKMFGIYIYILFPQRTSLKTYCIDNQLSCIKMYPASTQEKQQLLQQFVQHGENMKAIEMNLQVTKEQEGETCLKRELLTIREMKSRGFSQNLI